MARTRHRSRRVPVWELALGLLVLVAVFPARAELSVRGAVGAGAMTSPDQRDVFVFDRAAALGDAHLELSCLGWLRARGGGSYAFFGAHGPLRAGQVLAPSLGLEGHVRAGGARPYVSVDLGSAFTGKLVRPLLAVAVGVDFDAHARVALGPAVGYGRVFEHNRPGLSGDAGFVWVGVSLHFRAPPPVQPRPTAARQPPPRHVEREPPSATPEETSAELLALIDNALPTSTQQIELLAPVLFDLDTDALTPAGIAMLHEVAHALVQHHEYKRIGIRGYADSRGSTAHNQELSRRRAEAVQAWLIAHQVAPERLSIDARGADEPVENGAAEPAHTQNRRVVFRVLEREAP